MAVNDVVSVGNSSTVALLGNGTRKIANLLAKEIKCEVEEIIDYKKRNGFFGYIV